MVISDLEAHLAANGYAIERLQGGDGREYLVIKSVQISGGRLDGQVCDIALHYSTTTPWVPEAAVHGRPHLVPMNTLNTQPSPAGPEWQYWSRRFDRPPTPRGFLTHILTLLGEVA